MTGGREIRVVGTPATRVSLTDGHIVQAATYATLRRDPTGHRHQWGHYLAQPGVLEVLGTESEENLATGFLTGQASANTLDLSAVNVRAMANIQRNEELDHNPPFRSRRTSLRWSAEAADSCQEMTFTLYPDGLRVVRIRTDEFDPRALADFCADLALHDWLLSTLLDLVDRAMSSRRSTAELIALLRPGIDHLVHAWMPAAHTNRPLTSIWQEFDTKSGFSLQWHKTVERIRDQLSMAIIEALRPPRKSPESEPT